MMWLQPAALWLMTLAAVPIAIHLLRTRRSKRVAFPSVRFVRPSQTASVRLRAPSDLLLLALRVTIVALAGLACAQPLWITPAREAAWNARIARAIVVDASESMRDSVAADAVRAGVARESAAFASRTFESADIGDGITRAVTWLGHVPPARREIVVISDFQLGSMAGADVGDVPASVGLRFERVMRPTVATSSAVRRLAAQSQRPGHTRSALRGEERQLSCRGINQRQRMACGSSAVRVRRVLRLRSCERSRQPEHQRRMPPDRLRFALALRSPTLRPPDRRSLDDRDCCGLVARRGDQQTGSLDYGGGAAARAVDGRGARPVRSARGARGCQWRRADLRRCDTAR